MDDLLGEETSPATTEQEVTLPVTQEIIQSSTTPVVSSPVADPLVHDNTQKTDIHAKAKSPVIVPKKSLTKSLAMAAAGLFGVVVIGFVVTTMFPAGIDGTQGPEDIIAQEPISSEPEEHTVAEEQTPQQIAR